MIGTRSTIVTLLLLAFTLGAAHGQQQADSAFVPHVEHPAFGKNAPRVLIDEAHNNFHTAEGRYRPFAQLLTADGFRVEPSTSRFERGLLPQRAILVIANAMGTDVVASYDEPAFTDRECDAVAAWVRAGGALLLIADHAPFGTGAESLARRFGVSMGKGYTEDPVLHEEGRSPSTLVFSRSNGLLRRHPIIDGRNAAESVTRVIAYTGQSLAAPPGARVLLALGAEAFDHPGPTAKQAAAVAEPGMAWMTAVAGLPTRPARGRAMAVALPFGRGRVVVFGEAALFTAQIVKEASGTRRMGMGANNDNEKLVLNVMRWLARLLPGG